MDKLERQEEPVHLRGCGDPNCSLCNPDLVGRGFPSGLARGFDPVADAISASLRGAQYEIRRPVSMGFGSGESWIEYSDGSREYSTNISSGNTTDPATPSPPKPPSSYHEAREKVEKWIKPAPEQSFDDILGNEEALAELRDAIEAPVKHTEVYQAYGLAMPKGALLSGPPGCGKTMFARAAACEMKRLYGEEVLLLSISGTEIQSPYVGVTEQHITSIFAFAREYRAFHGHPLLVFIDEADALLPDRTGRVRRVASWEESQVATFLAEMDGMQQSGAFVLLATNRPEVIDQAVLRDGRCDFKIVVKRPNQQAVEAIVRRNFGTAPLKDKLDELVFAAVESLYDPHRVIAEAHAIWGDREGPKGHLDRHFCLEHLVSGAIAASVPKRAARKAFQRDREKGKAKGIIVADVIASVNDLFEENRKLEHGFALAEFREEFQRDAIAASEKPASKLH